MSKKTTYTVDTQFILDGHASACSDWKKKIEDKFPELFRKEMTYKIGQKFKRNTGDIYMLSSTAHNADSPTIGLINTGTGNLWAYPKPVKSIHTITEAELKSIFDGETFTLVK
jgi:hypothetical protein